MKSVMLSIKPKYCELIANGKKTVEVRKTKPKIEVPFKCYIYQSGKALTKTLYGSQFSKNGYVIGEFVCDKIMLAEFEFDFGYAGYVTEWGIGDCLTPGELLDYGNPQKYLYGWHISDLVIYDKPKELGEFCKSNILCYDDWLYGIYNGKGGATASYESYKNFFRIKRPPQSWCYVEELI